MNDAEFERHVAEQLATVGGVDAVALGGSRASGIHRPDSDWDFGVYYRDGLDTDAIRRLGWPGTVFEPGEWGGGVFNGGAWLHVDGRKVDLVYRDLDDVECRWAEARVGRFQVERLMFYVAGVPTYVVVGELALNRVLVGDLPRPEYPAALSTAAQQRWHSDALMTLDYARRSFVVLGDSIGAAAHIGRAILEEAHGRLAARREWVLNEKRLALRGGFAALVPVLGRLGDSGEAMLERFEIVESAIRGEPGSPMLGGGGADE
jgi:predicted nucleotidyltransferase